MSTAVKSTPFQLALGFVQKLPRTHRLLATASLSLLIVVMLLPAPTPSRIVVELPAYAAATQANAIEAISSNTRYINHVVNSGETLAAIFSKHKISQAVMLKVLATDKSLERLLTRLMPGEELGFTMDGDTLIEIDYKESSLVSHKVSLSDLGSYQLESITRTPEIETHYAFGTIDSSLFTAGMQAGISDNMIMDLANIFGWDIDFVLDIRKGDSFQVIYEKQFVDGEYLGLGNILAAQFINNGRTITAIRYTDAQGKTDFYTPDGKAMRKAFLRSPVDFVRISSPFNPNRKHPILNTIRAHNGTDYAAPSGTPIRATGDGKVIFAGVNGGYGNSIKIQHGQTYRTVYAHMKNFAKGIRNGSQVKQGQIIGYVGQTGLATGPHLHFEFQVNGVNKNPTTVTLPSAQPLPKSEMPQFDLYASYLVNQLEAIASIENEHQFKLAQLNTSN